MTEVTAGLPVFNNGGTLARAVESLLVQTRPPAKILVSDNASTDSTDDVGQDLARRYPAVTYIRQKANIGSSSNFRFLLGEAKTPYFMWLAGDDYLLPRYIEATAGCLDARPEVVSCVTKVQFHRDNVPTGLATGGAPLTASIRENLARYLIRPGANARFYGMHRRDALRAAFPPRHFHAFDWAVMAGMLLQGKQAEIDEILLVRDETPGEAYVGQVKRDNKTIMSRLFPLLPMTGDLIFRQRIPMDSHIARALLRINLEHHLQYTAKYHPRYYSMIGRRMAQQLWRVEPRSLRT